MERRRLNVIIEFTRGLLYACRSVTLHSFNFMACNAYRHFEAILELETFF